MSWLAGIAAIFCVALGSIAATQTLKRFMKRASRMIGGA